MYVSIYLSWVRLANKWGINCIRTDFHQGIEETSSKKSLLPTVLTEPQTEPKQVDINSETQILRPFFGGWFSFLTHI